MNRLELLVRPFQFSGQMWSTKRSRDIDGVACIQSRLRPGGVLVLATSVATDPEHVFTEAVFSASMVQAIRQVSRAEVPEMPDRMVAATAVDFDVPVISRDGGAQSLTVLLNETTH